MERIAADPTQIIPKRPSRMNRSFFMDREMLKILNLVDGKRTLADIASAALQPIASIQRIVKKLLDAGLVELVVTSENAATNRSFFSFLGQQLSVAIGPIADLFIEDEIELMGESWKNFPRERMPELVNALARQIPRENARIAFQHNMLHALKGIVSG